MVYWCTSVNLISPPFKNETAFTHYKDMYATFQGSMDGRVRLPFFTELNLLPFLSFFLLSIDCIDPLILPNEQSFTRDVDEKANAYFQAIYNKSMSVDKLLELLKQFKDSSVKKDRVCSVQVIITPSVDDMYFFSGFVCLYAEKHV